jgi:salicylate hydroxylase
MGKPRIVIIGAGIGGLAAALAMRRRGGEVALFEQARESGDVGAGLQIGPNAVKVLRKLGLERPLMEVSSELGNMVELDWNDGKLKSLTPLGPTAREKFGAPYLTAHRADLHRVLYEALPPTCVAFGKECVAVAAHRNNAVARFADGTEVEGDAVIGCDGIHSVVRRSVFGRDRPLFTKQIFWRGTLGMDRIKALGLDCFGADFSLKDYVSWLGPTGRVLCYPMYQGRVLNIAAGYVTEKWTAESWSAASTREEVLAAYPGWDERLLAIFRAVERWFKWGVFDRDPMRRWSLGAVSLLGDAAHPMHPTLAQGAAMAIEDAYVLADCLSRHEDDLPLALQDYETRRKPRTERAQLQARQQFRNNLAVPSPPRLDRDWIFAFDATAL